MVNVVEAGADPEAGQRIDGLLREQAADGTLLYFPPGRYRVGRVVFEDRSRFGLLGEDATLVPDVRGRNVFLAFRRAADIHVEGFHVDATGKNTAAWTAVECVGGHNVFRDYAVEGFGDVSESTFGLTLLVQGADTSLLVDRADLRDGAANGIAAFTFPRREFPDPNQPAGSLTFRDCVMKGWGAEGLYASPHSGPLAVLGGEYANNAIDQVRIGGGNAPERAVVSGVTVRVTRVPPYVPAARRVFRGIWLKEGDRATVENCDVAITGIDPAQTAGGIVVNDQFGRATVRDTEVTIDVGRPALVAKRPADEYDPQWMPSLDQLPPEWGVDCRNLSLRSVAPDAPAVEITGRSGCTFANVDVTSEGSRSDALRLREATDCRIAGASLSATRFPVLSVTYADDDCGLELRRSTLTTGLDDVGELLSVAADHQFCVGNSVFGDSSENGQVIALTRTEVNGTASTETPTGEPPLSLFGRRAERWW